MVPKVQINERLLDFFILTSVAICQLCLWKFMKAHVCLDWNEKDFVCLRRSVTVMYFFLSPSWWVLHWYQKRGRALHLCYRARYVFDTSSEKPVMWWCYSLFMGSNNNTNSTLCIHNCFDLNFLKCFIRRMNNENLGRLHWVIPQHSILSLAVTKVNFWSPTSNPLQLGCFPKSGMVHTNF